jgi:hypothetical protein
MGVPGFRTWFESQFPKSVYEIPKAASNESFDHVLVDVNALLHICLRKSRTDGHALGRGQTRYTTQSTISNSGTDRTQDETNQPDFEYGTEKQ